MLGQSSVGKGVKLLSVTKIKEEFHDEHDEDSVFCKICSKGFVYETALINHVRVEHTDEYYSGDPTKWKLNKKPTGKATMSLASKDVSYIVIKTDNTPPPEPKRRRKKAERAPKESVQRDINGPFECHHPSTQTQDGICHQTFLSCCEYTKHYKNEHIKGRKLLKCHVCEKPLVYYSGSQERPFVCQTCGESFEAKKALARHTATVHEKAKRYQCEHCQKKFKQWVTLVQHLRWHNGERPFKCEYCPKSFSQKAGRDQHLRVHTKEKPYLCVLCSKAFSQSIHLKVHMRTHTQLTPYQCGICDKRFKQSVHLNKHLKFHNPANMTEEERSKYSDSIALIVSEELEDDPSEIEYADDASENETETVPNEECEVETVMMESDDETVAVIE